MVVGLDAHRFDPQVVPSYLEAVHQVQSSRIEPYLDSIHRSVCSQCIMRGCDGCPCPMDYLLVLLVQAIETVDRRREQEVAC